MTFFAIDIGNTRLKWAQYATPQPGAVLLAQGAVFLETIDTLAETEWKRLAAPRSMLGCVVAGEAIRRRVEEQLELWDIEPRWVVPSARAGGVTNGYDHPNRLGADRWTALDRRPPPRARAGGAAAGAGGDGRHRGDGGRTRHRGPLHRRPDPARLRPDAARPRDGHGRPEGTDRRGGGLSDQHERRADERRRARDRRRGRADAAQAARAHRPGTAAADERRRRGRSWGRSSNCRSRRWTR